jgi:hypothetical protein
LYWVLALLRGNNPIPRNNDDNDVQNEKKSHHRSGGSLRIIDKQNLAGTLAGHTKRDLRDSLECVSKEKSKKGLLASLLLRYF